jgi:nucleotide-binding universal stress UspA family protein
MRRFLVALDQSEEALKVVRYVAETLEGARDVEVTLFHAIPDLLPFQPEFGLGVLPEVQERVKERTREQMAAVFGQARAALVKAGLPEASIKTEIKPATPDVAREVLAEAEEGRYQTIVIGRRGMGRVQQFLLGSVSNKVVQHARGRTVWVVE